MVAKNIFISIVNNQLNYFHDLLSVGHRVNV